MVEAIPKPMLVRIVSDGDGVRVLMPDGKEIPGIHHVEWESYASGGSLAKIFCWPESVDIVTEYEKGKNEVA